MTTTTREHVSVFLLISTRTSFVVSSKFLHKKQWKVEERLSKNHDSAIYFHSIEIHRVPYFPAVSNITFKSLGIIVPREPLVWPARPGSVNFSGVHTI